MKLRGREEGAEGRKVGEGVGEKGEDERKRKGGGKGENIEKRGRGRRREQAGEEVRRNTVPMKESARMACLFGEPRGPSHSGTEWRRNRQLFPRGLVI